MSQPGDTAAATRMPRRIDQQHAAEQEEQPQAPVMTSASLNPAAAASMDLSQFASPSSQTVLDDGRSKHGMMVDGHGMPLDAPSSQQPHHTHDPHPMSPYNHATGKAKAKVKKKQKKKYTHVDDTPPSSPTSSPTVDRRAPSVVVLAQRDALRGAIGPSSFGTASLSPTTSSFLLSSGTNGPGSNLMSRMLLGWRPAYKRVLVEGVPLGSKDAVFFAPDDYASNRTPTSFVNIDPRRSPYTVHVGDAFEISFLGMSIPAEARSKQQQQASVVGSGDNAPQLMLYSLAKMNDPLAPGSSLWSPAQAQTQAAENGTGNGLGVGAGGDGMSSVTHSSSDGSALGVGAAANGSSTAPTATTTTAGSGSSPSSTVSVPQIDDGSMASTVATAAGAPGVHSQQSGSTMDGTGAATGSVPGVNGPAAQQQLQHHQPLHIRAASSHGTTLSGHQAGSVAYGVGGGGNGVFTQRAISAGGVAQLLQQQQQQHQSLFYSDKAVLYGSHHPYAFGNGMMTNSAPHPTTTTATTAASMPYANPLSTDLPFIHYDPVVDAHDSDSDCYIPVPATKALYLRCPGSNGTGSGMSTSMPSATGKKKNGVDHQQQQQEGQRMPQSVSIRFTVMEIDKQIPGSPILRGTSPAAAHAHGIGMSMGMGMPFGDAGLGLGGMPTTAEAATAAGNGPSGGDTFTLLSRAFSALDNRGNGRAARLGHGGGSGLSTHSVDMEFLLAEREPDSDSDSTCDDSDSDSNDLQQGPSGINEKKKKTKHTAGMSSTKSCGNYLQYGYYFFLSDKVDAKLYAQTCSSSQSIPLLLKREGFTKRMEKRNEKEYFPLTGVSYLVAKVSRGCRHADADSKDMAMLRLQHRQKLESITQMNQVIDMVSSMQQQSRLNSAHGHAAAAAAAAYGGQGPSYGMPSGMSAKSAARSRW